jgi:hypothetical protein
MSDRAAQARAEWQQEDRERIDHLLGIFSCDPRLSVARREAFRTDASVDADRLHLAISAIERREAQERVVRVEVITRDPYTGEERGRASFDVPAKAP